MTRTEKRYIHHYNYARSGPPARPVRAARTSRREIGHGALAEKALAAGHPVR